MFGPISKLAFFEIEGWEREYLESTLQGYELGFFGGALDKKTAGLLRDVDVLSVFINSSLVASILEYMPNLKLIATRSTGYDHIDINYCNKQGIVVSNVPLYGEETVAEHTFGLMLSLSRNIHKAYVRTTRGDFSLEGLRGFDLEGKTLGVVGAGHIGLHVIKIAKGFAMNIIAFDVRPEKLISEVLGFEYVSMEDLLRRSDIITLHAPYIPSTHHMINKDSIKIMKKGVLLINTARGGLIDTEALIDGLDDGTIGGAGLDVLEGEELIKEEKELLSMPAVEGKLKALLRQHMLLRRDNVVITPHIAFNSVEALLRILDTTASNIKSFAAGEPANVVNPGSLGKAGNAA